MGVTKSQPESRYITNSCQHCGGKIEFDANQLAEGETRLVPCPHCHVQTVLSVPPPTQPPETTPTTLQGFVGQERAKARIGLAIEAAKQRGEALAHILLCGPPGVGKTTLANIIANSMGATLKSTNGPTLEKAADVAGLLTNLEAGDMLFIDEVHRVQKTVVEYLCPAMESFKLDVIIDQGSNARSVRLNLPPFTLVGTAPRADLLSPKLLKRFPIIENLDAYSAKELKTLTGCFARALNTETEVDAIDRIARSSDGTPLDVLNRFRNIRDYAQVKAGGIITAAVAEDALKLLPSAQPTEDSAQQRQAIPSTVRREVWRRDGGKCVRCGSRENLEYDHIIPVAKGGSNTARNLELLCEACNRSKSDSIQ